MRQKQRAMNKKRCHDEITRAQRQPQPPTSISRDQNAAAARSTVRHCCSHRLMCLREFFCLLSAVCFGFDFCLAMPSRVHCSQLVVWRSCLNSTRFLKGKATSNFYRPAAPHDTHSRGRALSTNSGAYTAPRLVVFSCLPCSLFALLACPLPEGAPWQSWPRALPRSHGAPLLCYPLLRTGDPASK
jgi:hypothetical protein